MLFGFKGDGLALTAVTAATSRPLRCHFTVTSLKLRRHFTVTSPQPRGLVLCRNRMAGGLMNWKVRIEVVVAYKKHWPGIFSAELRRIINNSGAVQRVCQTLSSRAPLKHTPTDVPLCQPAALCRKSCHSFQDCSSNINGCVPARGERGEAMWKNHPTFTPPFCLLLLA
jgi:hypothetical protein